MMIGGSGDILCERMVGCWGNGPVWCSILVLQLRCEQGSCSIIYQNMENNTFEANGNPSRYSVRPMRGGRESAGRGEEIS